MIQPGTGYTFSTSGNDVTLNIEKPWPGEFDPDIVSPLVIELYRPHPFRIIKVTSETALGGGFFYNLYPDTGSVFFVAPGTVNGTLCSLGPTACGSSTTYVYVKTYPDSGIGVVTSSSPLSNSESSAYVLIGTVDVFGKQQFVKSNLLRERYKLGQGDADYHHSYTDLV
jgi:hypothetical protein